MREFQGLARRAKRKLEALHAVARLEDLRVPPSNRLEKLRSYLQGFHSIRINDQWRIIFQWVDNNAYGSQSETTTKELNMARGEFAPVTPGEMLKEEFLAEYGLSQN